MNKFDKKGNKTMTKQEPNFEAFLPVGIIFIGTGIALMAAVNPGVGIGIMVVGILFLVAGIKKRKEKKN